MANVKISGLKEIQRELKKIGDKKAVNIMTAGLRAGAGEIAKRAKANAPKDSGNLAKSIGVTKRKTPKTFVKFTVSPQLNKSVTTKGEKRIVDGRYAVNLEYGTQFQPAQPFMRPTFDQLGQNVTVAITKRIAQRIEKEANKV